MSQEVVELSNVEIPLTLKAKDIFIVASFLRTMQIESIFSIVSKIKGAVNSETLDTDDVVINISPVKIMDVINILGSNTERDFSASNRVMMTSLTEQLTAILSGEDSDIKTSAQTLVANLMVRSESINSNIDAIASAGRTFIFNIQ